MKKIILIVTLLLGSFVIENVTAQLRLKVNINLQPIWGPVGYDHAEYYYMPDIDAFYNVPNRQYIYQERGRWIFSASLPARFRNFDLYSGYKVVINDDPRPYNHAETFRAKYGGFKGQHNQEIIRNSKESKYFQIKDHPQHNNWQKEKNRKKN